MRRTLRTMSAAALVLGLAGPVARVEAQTAPATGIKAEIIRSIEAAENHLEALAEKFPQEKYGWRPGEGVRSTSEVFMHIAAGNYGYSRAIGTPPPEGTTGTALSKITDKAKVIETLKASFAHIKAAIQNTPDVEKAIKLYGRDATVREAMIVAATHCHEHLGQLIAYARVNGIVPPWSEETPAKPPSKN